MPGRETSYSAESAFQSHRPHSSEQPPQPPFIGRGSISERENPHSSQPTLRTRQPHSSEHLPPSPPFIIRGSMSDRENPYSTDSALRSHHQQSLRRSMSARENPYSTGSALRPQRHSLESPQPPPPFVGRGARENPSSADSDPRTDQPQTAEQSRGYQTEQSSRDFARDPRPYHLRYPPHR
jgi:hypothetical protein